MSSIKKESSIQHLNESTPLLVTPLNIKSATSSQSLSTTFQGLSLRRDSVSSNNHSNHTLNNFLKELDSIISQSDDKNPATIKIFNRLGNNISNEDHIKNIKNEAQNSCSHVVIFYDTVNTEKLKLKTALKDEKNITFISYNAIKNYFSNKEINQCVETPLHPPLGSTQNLPSDNQKSPSRANLIKDIIDHSKTLIQTNLTGRAVDEHLLADLYIFNELYKETVKNSSNTSNSNGALYVQHQHITKNYDPGWVNKARDQAKKQGIVQGDPNVIAIMYLEKSNFTDSKTEGKLSQFNLDNFYERRGNDNEFLKGNPMMHRSFKMTNTPKKNAYTFSSAPSSEKKLNMDSYYWEKMNSLSPESVEDQKLNKLGYSYINKKSIQSWTDSQEYDNLENLMDAMVHCVEIQGKIKLSKLTRSARNIAGSENISEIDLLKKFLEKIRERSENNSSYSQNLPENILFRSDDFSEENLNELFENSVLFERVILDKNYNAKYSQKNDDEYIDDDESDISDFSPTARPYTPLSGSEDE